MEEDEQVYIPIFPDTAEETVWVIVVSKKALLQHSEIDYE